jgi:hypothetical protein
VSGEHQHLDLEQADDEQQAALDDAVTRLSVLEAAPPVPGGGGGTAGEPGVIEIDDPHFSTSSMPDDDKVAAVLSYVAAQTNKPTVRFRHGLMRLTRTITMFTGARFIGGGGGVAVEQPRGGNPYSTLVDFKGTDPTKPLFLYPSGQTYGTFIGHMAIQGTATSTLVNSASSSAVAWRAVFRDLGMANMGSCFGSPAQKFLITASTWDGDHNYNNVRSAVGIRVGGSDNDFLCSKLLLDSPTSLNSGVQSLFWADYLEKTPIYGLYITAEGAPTGIRVTGNTGTEPVTFMAPRVEGRNAGQPANAALIRVEGGDVNIIAPWIAYGMANPGSSGDTGLVSIRGGDVIIDMPTFGKATATASTVPMISATGGTVRVVNARRRPLVRAVAPAELKTDDSVTVS